MKSGMIAGFPIASSALWFAAVSVPSSWTIVETTRIRIKMTTQLPRTIPTSLRLGTRTPRYETIPSRSKPRHAR